MRTYNTNGEILIKIILIIDQEVDVITCKWSYMLIIFRVGENIKIIALVFVQKLLLVPFKQCDAYLTA